MNLRFATFSAVAVEAVFVLEALLCFGSTSGEAYGWKEAFV